MTDNFKFEVLAALPVTEPIRTIDLTKKIYDGDDQLIFEREKARVLTALNWLRKWGYAEQADRTTAGATWRRIR